MSDTPETDNALQGVWYRGDHGSAIPELCRRLERERDHWRSEHDRVTREFQHRLVTLATAMIEASTYPEPP